MSPVGMILPHNLKMRTPLYRLGLSLAQSSRTSDAFKFTALLIRFGRGRISDIFLGTVTSPLRLTFAPTVSSATAFLLVRQMPNAFDQSIQAVLLK